MFLFMSIWIMWCTFDHMHMVICALQALTHPYVVIIINFFNNLH